VIDTSGRVMVAAALIWLGMVLAISFLEAPLKFRTPGLDVRVGLAIGRIVFRALNMVEILWAVIILVCLIVDPPTLPAAVAAGIAVALLAAQLLVVRPWLNRRSDRVLAGAVSPEMPRSRAHLVYVAMEGLKVIALIVSAALLLRA
jgi:hypothetical protein